MSGEESGREKVKEAGKRKPMGLTQEEDNTVIPPRRGSKKLKEYQDNDGRGSE